MNIDKAIEIKARTGEEFLHTDPDDIDEADRLGSEALKFVASWNDKQLPQHQIHLSGETED